MPIYDIFETKEPIVKLDGPIPQVVEGIHPFSADAQEAEIEGNGAPVKDRFFSSAAARLFFLLLLAADILWAIYSLCLFTIFSTMAAITGFKAAALMKKSSKAWISVKRSLVCGLALFVALFSPAFGIMVACTYFLMYDKAGIEEVVPASLQDQFKDFFRPES